MKHPMRQYTVLGPDFARQLPPPIMISAVSMSSLCELLAEALAVPRRFQHENLLDATVRSAAMPRLAPTDSVVQGCGAWLSTISSPK